MDVIMHIVYENLPMHIVLNHIDSDFILYPKNGIDPCRSYS